MKKTIFSLIVLLLVLPILGIGNCQEWVTANQVTILWDPVTKLENGEPIPSSDTIEYTVYLVRESDTEKSDPIEIITVNVPTYTITLGVEGHYYVGLQTVRRCPQGDIVSRSVIGWSDDPAIVSDGVIFGVCYYLAPSVPGGLHPAIILED